AVEAQFVAEVIVDRRDVHARGAADFTDGHLLEPAAGKQAGCHADHALPGDPIAPLHSVRRKRSVAAVIATTEKVSRNRRSKEIAVKPVFFSSSDLNACTE